MEKYILGNGLNVDIFAEITDIDVALDLVKECNAIYLGYDYIAAMQRHPDIRWKMLDAEVSGQNMYIAGLKILCRAKCAVICKIFIGMAAHTQQR